MRSDKLRREIAAISGRSPHWHPVAALPGHLGRIAKMLVLESISRAKGKGGYDGDTVWGHY
jgi:hypothetical protein